MPNVLVVVCRRGAQSMSICSCRKVYPVTNQIFFVDKNLNLPARDIEKR